MVSFITHAYASTDRNAKFKKFGAIANTFPNSKIISDQIYEPSDLAIIYSWVDDKKVDIGSEGKVSMKRYKREIIEGQRNAGKFVMPIDNSLFVYKDQSYRYNYLRFSIGGVFANDGHFFDNHVDRKRWERIKRNLSIDVKPWRNQGDHVLICMQRSNGFTFNYENGTEEWLTNTLVALSNHTDRRIVIRPHPGDGRLGKHISNAIHNVTMRRLGRVHVRNHITVSQNKTIEEDLRGAWACVTYNSSPSTVSAIEGIPVFVLDPEPRKSHAYPVANTYLSNIENPNMPDNRQEWLERLAMSHFSYGDIENGLLYKTTAQFFEEKNARL